MIENKNQGRLFISLSKSNEHTKDEELFQNGTLRPIIKMQHDLLISLFFSYIVSKKCAFHVLTAQQKLSFIEGAFGKDMPFRNKIKGMIIGHFKPHEFQQYIGMQKEADKRIINIIQKRIIDESI